MSNIVIESLEEMESFKKMIASGPQIHIQAGKVTRLEPAHGHYFKDVSKLQKIDVYRVTRLFGVTDPCISHAIKKLLVAGGRGAKDVEKDIQEAIDSLVRWQEMALEDKA